MKRSEIIACIDTLALELASKIADHQRFASAYQHMSDELEALRRRIMPGEDHPRNLDTHELVSSVLGRRRTA